MVLSVSIILALVALISAQEDAPPLPPAPIEPQLLPSPNIPIEDITEIPKTYAGTFLVVAPRVVRPGRPYAVSIQILDSAHADLVVRLEIRDSNNQTIATKIQPGVKTKVPQTIEIPEVPANRLLDGGRYQVYVRGETIDNKVQFEAMQDVNYDQKSFSIFVQTDKAVYKPGSLVNFRAVLVKPDLKPYDGMVHIKIKDPNDNTIMQRMNTTLTKGVATDKLQLVDEPPLGDWRIMVETADGSTQYDKTFTVDKYVLPKFEVKIEPPSFVTKDQDVSVKVVAKYTYGKGVEGRARVIVRHPWRWQWRSMEIVGNEEKKYQIEKQVSLDTQGEATVTVQLSELKEAGLVEEYGSSEYEFIATVTEGLTGIERNGTGRVTAHKDDVQLELHKGSDSFKPGLDYQYVVAAKQPNDAPLPADRPRKVQLLTVFSFPWTPDQTEDRSIEKLEVVELGADGTKLMTTQAPVNCTNLRVEARYDRKGDNVFNESEIYTSLYADAGKSPTNSFLQLTKIGTEESVPVGQTVKFTLKSTEKFEKVTMQVMSRGVMLQSSTVDMSGDSANIDIVTTADMAPKSRLIVYAVRADNKEILVDAMDFKVSGLFRNQVSLGYNATELRPGAPVALTVKAQPGSFVGVLAVDQSVLLLKSGNDITAEMVEEDMERYDTTGYGGWGGPWGRFGRRKKRSFFPWWGIGGKDAQSIFNNAGLIVLTDALLYSEPIPPIMPFMARGGMLPGGMPGMPGPEGMPGPMPMPAPAPQPIAAAGGAAPVAPRTRHKFPETWLWASTNIQENGETVVEATVPDTITSWIASAFAVHDEAGLGVAKDTAKLNVFQPFFVRLNLPYSVKRGEKMALQVLVFNYQEAEQTVEVILKHDENSDFDFVEKTGALVDSKNTKGANIRSVRVRGGGGSAAVFFPIVPKKIGQLMLEVSARADTAGDIVRQELKVEPEGYQIDRNVPIVIDLSSERNFERKVTMEFPGDAVEGSQVAKFDLIGDIMGPVLNNIEGLVRMPYGCGEQNMLNFVPNIVVMKYLDATRREETALREKAKKYMEAGYQRELTYKRDDHSFSAFGKSDEHGSTWLTAFVVRSFKQAQQYIFVDEMKLKESIGYLLEQQMENGAFAEKGEVHHKDMQGGAADGGIGMTAYVLMALLENGVQNTQAVNYLEQSLDSLADKPYELAVVTYALHLANSAQKDKAYGMLQTIVKEKDGTKFWEDQVGDEPPPKGEDGEPLNYFYQPKPVNVEMTSYALLTMMLRKETEKALPVVRWLTNQRNAYGGYSSTQDTVMALQALGAYASVAYSPNFNVQVTVESGSAQPFSFTVDPSNAILLRSAQIDDINSAVTVKATGTGVVFGQLQYHYHLTKKRRDDPFDCQPELFQPAPGADGKPASRVTLSMCCKYNKEGKSNMAVMEIDSLSGFQFDADEIEELKMIRGLQRVELEKGDTKTNIYLNPLGSDTVCMNVSSQMVYQVADQKPANVRLFDYYNPQLEVKMAYGASMRKASLQEACPDCWSNMAEGAVAEGRRHLRPSASAQMLAASTLLAFASAFIIIAYNTL